MELIDNTNTLNILLNNNIVEENKEENVSLESRLINLLDKWTDTVKELNTKMKTLTSLDELLNEVYYKRQEAVDLYYGTMRVQASVTRDYRSKASKIYTALKSGQAGLRFTNENSISLLIESQLSNEKQNMDILSNFTSFIKETIQTIDNIIYGINSKIKVYEMMNGMKF